METQQYGHAGTAYQDTFNFLASLINGNDFWVGLIVSAYLLSFNFLASLINGNGGGV